MAGAKTLHARQAELQLYMATPEGRRQLHALADRYHAAGGSMKPEQTSVITYILVDERRRGLIVD